jgi:hypothetical protein
MWRASLVGNVANVVVPPPVSSGLTQRQRRQLQLPPPFLPVAAVGVLTEVPQVPMVGPQAHMAELPAQVTGAWLTWCTPPVSRIVGLRSCWISYLRWVWDSLIKCLPVGPGGLPLDASQAQLVPLGTCPQSCGMRAARE